MTDGVTPSISGPVCGFIPPYLLERIRACDDEHLTRCASDTLILDTTLRATRATSQGVDVAVAGEWAIHTAGNTTTLPGRLVRSAGERESGDTAVDEAATGITATLALYSEVFGRDSYDGHGAGVLATVHYGVDYDNAFWNGAQLVFGDGDQKIFGRFTKPIDVLGHELSHALTEKTAGLTYQGQSGALNESISDVFGACMKQRVLGQNAADADWLVGQGIFLPSVHGTALRSMKEPGTAYDDPALGKDPQVATMDDYVDTTDDNGGVHTNSGIPNKAFYLVASGIGGNSWEAPGVIWYEALKASSPDTDFQAFADTTFAKAGQLYGTGSPEQQAVFGAWQGVEIKISGVSPLSVRISATSAGGNGVAPESLPSRVDDLASQIKALTKEVNGLRKARV